MLKMKWPIFKHLIEKSSILKATLNCLDIIYNIQSTLSNTCENIKFSIIVHKFVRTVTLFSLHSASYLTHSTLYLINSEHLFGMEGTIFFR